MNRHQILIQPQIFEDTQSRNEPQFLKDDQIRNKPKI